MPPTLQSIICRNPEMIANEIDGDLVIMSLTTDAFFALNSVGIAIWDLLEKPTAVEAIIAHILATFDVSQQQCESDVLLFIENMLNSNTIFIR